MKDSTSPASGFTERRSSVGKSAAGASPQVASPDGASGSTERSAVGNGAGAPGAVLSITPLGFPWATIDPFLFCAHHDDAYPEGNGQLGPRASLAGRELGQDFSRKDGWSMYHGDTVPGFPAHPHRGFETVTIVRQGLIDHADSLGAAARFGHGDVQWLTAGRGIVHAEMFPLLDTDSPNPVELFQIWLNLPARSKMALPHFKMIWNGEVPRVHERDEAGRATQVALIAGSLSQAHAAAPPPDSWAAQADADVAIWTIHMEPGARWTLPAASGDGTRRQLYFFKGGVVRIGGEEARSGHAIEVRSNSDIELVNGEEPAEFLLLQGRPIGEPVAQYGPFVMNTETEIRQTLSDYRRTQFGGWQWPDQAPVHGSDPEHFARHPDGRRETAPPSTPPA
ncbi:MAG TPA: pirin family protein [Lautropia sp.]|nr:pirin family protein [Lautropia sp.]